MGASGAIPTTYERCRGRARSYCVKIPTCASRSLPEHSPRLDRICAEHTAFPRFEDLHVAVAGYRPSIRLDLIGRDGAVLAHAYDRAQARRGNPRRGFVIEEISDGEDIKAYR